MESTTLVSVLNELLCRESQALAPRLFESTVSVSRYSLRDFQVVQRLAQATTRHAQLLAALILDLGGVPSLREADITTADLHFLELHFVLPRLVRDQEATIRTYRLAASQVSTKPSIAKAIGEILAEHERNLGELQVLLSAPNAKAS